MGEQILIAEDDADINNLLAKILRTEHFKPIQAFSGTEAKLLFMHNTPDLILLDLMLPGLSGEELLSELREIFLLTYQSSYCLQKLPWQTKCHF